MENDIEKLKIMFQLLAANIKTDFISKAELKTYTDEIALLNRKRESLIKDKKRLERNIKRAKHTIGNEKNNDIQQLVQMKDPATLTLKQVNQLFKNGKYLEAKKGYELLINTSPIYDSLKINIQLCNKFLGSKFVKKEDHNM